MRAYRLHFIQGIGYVVAGIKALPANNGMGLYLFSHEDRGVMMPIVPSHLPLLTEPDKTDSLLSKRLVQLSLLESVDGMIYLINECGDPGGAFIFVDTYDEVSFTTGGVYTFPKEQGQRLPSAECAAGAESAAFGLVSLQPGDSILIQTTSGTLCKLRLSMSDVPMFEQCSREEELLLRE